MPGTYNTSAHSTAGAAGSAAAEGEAAAAEFLAAADTAAAADKWPIGRGLQGDHLYDVPPEVLARVRQATSYTHDLGKKEKDLLTAAVKRGLERPECPPEALARWAEDHNQNRLHFLKEWVEDTSFASLLVCERHTRREEHFDETLYYRVTKVGLFRQFEADRFAWRKDWVTDVLRGARGQPIDHPDYPGEEDYKLHRVLKSVIDGQRTSGVREQGLGLESAVRPEHGAMAAEAARRIMEAPGGGAREVIPAIAGAPAPAPAPKRGAAADAPKKKAKKAKPEPTEEEKAQADAAKAAADEQKKNRKAAETHKRALGALSVRLQRTLGRLEKIETVPRLKMTCAHVEDLKQAIEQVREAESVRTLNAANSEAPPCMKELKSTAETAAKAAEAHAKEQKV